MVCATCTEGLEFKSRAGQILHSIANGSPPLQHFTQLAVALALWRGDGHRKLVTSFGVIRRVYWKVWFYWVKVDLNYLKTSQTFLRLVTENYLLLKCFKIFFSKYAQTSIMRLLPSISFLHTRSSTEFFCFLNSIRSSDHVTDWKPFMYLSCILIGFFNSLFRLLVTTHGLPKNELANNKLNLKLRFEESWTVFTKCCFLAQFLFLMAQLLLVYWLTE